jgi:transposase-like protein
MNKTIKEKAETKPVAKPPQSKRYEEAFKKQAVENWLQSGKPGTQIARELGVSYPTLKQWKRGYWGDAMPARPDLESEPSGAV